MIAVALGEFVHDVIASSFVDTRRELTQRLVAQRRRVQQRSDERTRSFGPVIVTSITTTTTRDVDKAPRSENRAVPRKTLSNRRVTNSVDILWSTHRSRRIEEQR